MKLWLLGGAAAVGLGFAAWQAVEALQQNDSAPQSTAAPVSTLATEDSDDEAAAAAGFAASAPTPAARAPRLSSRLTPMAERVATIGVLNKRNGIARDLTIKPGQALRLGNVIVRLRACERTAPWEPEQLTGAFVQVDVQNPRQQWQRVFSGWLYKETPSLNMVEHPIYDVWPKACTMNFPDIDDDTVVVTGGSSAPGSRSSAKKSDDAAPAADPGATTPPSAESSNTT